MKIRKNKINKIQNQRNKKLKRKIKNINRILKRIALWMIHLIMIMKLKIFNYQLVNYKQKISIYHRRKKKMNLKKMYSPNQPLILSSVNLGLILMKTKD
jgi:hypothetical protein